MHNHFGEILRGFGGEVREFVCIQKTRRRDRSKSVDRVMYDTYSDNLPTM